MSEKKNIVIAIFVFIIVVLFYQNNQLMKDLESIKDDRIKQAELIEVKEEKINKVIKDYDGAISTIEDLKEENQELIQEIEASKLPDYSSKFKLKKMGIDDYESIEKDLLEKPELISIDGVLGGTMFFNEAYLLNDEWVYASFEDGHIMGSGLYRFEVLSPNEIKWEEIVVTSD